jgi:uncharacterized iron-regulated protein
MLADLARADAIFVGELHDDPNTHRLELAILEGLARRRGDVTVAFEMFERDVQDALDRLSRAEMTEPEFLAASRPWPRYSTDYKPLVDFGLSRRWPLVAANVPRPMASEVARTGLAALASKSDADKRWFAQDLKCPTDDDYFDRFAESMGGHPSGDASSTNVRAERERLERYYFAQCLKDETMAESVARALERSSASAAAPARPLVVHFNGAFHSDFGLGAAERARRRLKGKRIVVVSILPVADLDALEPDKKERKRADYLVYTVKPAPPIRGTSSRRTPWRDSFATSPLLEPPGQVGNRVGHDGDRRGVVRHLPWSNAGDGVGVRVMDQKIIAAHEVRHHRDVAAGPGGRFDVGAAAGGHHGIGANRAQQAGNRRDDRPGRVRS